MYGSMRARFITKTPDAISPARTPFQRNRVVLENIDPMTSNGIHQTHLNKYLIGKSPRFLHFLSFS
ncbi:protein of unknown function [Burkholderia multivorans]